MPTRKKTEETTAEKPAEEKKPRATRARTAKAPAVEQPAETTTQAQAQVQVAQPEAGPKELPEYLKRRRTEVGRVVSDKMTNTVVVLVDRAKPHPLYRKIMRQSVKFMAHDEMGAAMGDRVRIIESRPMSKHKRWRVIEIIQRAEKI